ncbi:MAG: hypothetical protein ACK5N8_02205 [Alphaproteobacteria bacterium]
MTKANRMLEEKMGYLVGTIEAMDKRLQRMEEKQDKQLKVTAVNSFICSSVVGVATTIVIAKLKNSLGMM